MYAETDRKINEINANPNNTFTVGHNKFSTWTDDEYKRLQGARNPSTKATPVHFDTTDLPAEVNWVLKGMLNPIQEQGTCGSCWAFATTAAIESHHAKIVGAGDIVKLSEQQLVDCVEDGAYGCGGGDTFTAVKYLIENPQELETDYPYWAKDQKCQYNKDKGVVAATQLNAVEKNPEQMIAALYNKGPIMTGIYAHDPVFRQYTGGIINSTTCLTTITHAINIVGYSDNYWIVRNSFGPHWGEDGYARVERTEGPGICGINSWPAYPDTN